MLHSYQAIIENGQIKWLDTPPSETTAKVIVTILSPVNNDDPATVNPTIKKRQLGFMHGEMTFPDDINWCDEQIQDLFANNQQCSYN